MHDIMKVLEVAQRKRRYEHFGRDDRSKTGSRPMAKGFSKKRWERRWARVGIFSGAGDCSE